MWWPRDGSDEWLGRPDGVLATHLLRIMCDTRERSASQCEPVLEVGVWKGAWTQVVLKNVPGVSVDGVDPYPGYAEIGEAALESLRKLGVRDRFRLVSALSDLQPDARYSMVHLDGEHSECALELELQYADEHVVDDGIVVVDDYRNQWFPGVASALFRFLDNSDFRLFAVTGNKAYLARSGYASEYCIKVERTFSGSSELPVWTHWRQWDGESVQYVQSPSVRGQQVLLCGMVRPSAPSRRGRIARDLLPPVLTRALSTARHFTSRSPRAVRH